MVSGAIRRVRRHFTGAPVTLLLAAVTLVIFMIDRWSAAWVATRCLRQEAGHCLLVQTTSYPHVHTVTAWLGYERPAILRGELWRLLSPGFLNSLGWPHVAANLVSLLVFGPTCERLLGRVRYLFVYLACATAAYALLVVARPSRLPYSFGGASAAIFGVFMATFVLAVHERKWPPGARWAAVLAAAYLIAQVPLALYVPYTRTTLLREIHGGSLAAGLLIGGFLASRRHYTNSPRVARVVTSEATAEPAS